MNRIEDEELIHFNGINGSTGAYLFEEISAQHISKVAQGQPMTSEELDLLESKENAKAVDLSVEGEGGFRPIEKAGWAIVIADSLANRSEVIEALYPLIEHRTQQAGKLLKKRRYRGGSEVRISRWLARQGAGMGAVDPENMPYYILLVGSPKDIPFSFQYNLDTQYAVGRIYFDTVKEYAIYAQQVVRREKENTTQSKQATLFSVKNNHDRSTQQSSQYLIHPLYKKLNSVHSNWSLELVENADATKESLHYLLHQDKPPSFLLTASHGMGFDQEDPRQANDQGALLCSDWPGRHQWNKPIPEDFYYAGRDLKTDLNLQGMIVFIFACYSGATPQYDNFRKKITNKAEQIAEQDFISQLPTRLLTSGAGAIIAHVDRAWSSSFIGRMRADNTASIKSCIDQILLGKHVGHAMEAMNDYHAAQALEMDAILDDLSREDGFPISDSEVSNTYISRNDARNYIVLGDPAVRLVL
ncbi:MAG: hypothetical protein KAH22_05590 [Thiotrichaceae bacterium]|nr:hypothetical protein [Thiotrichaceae bacterium]